MPDRLRAAFLPTLLGAYLSIDYLSHANLYNSSCRQATLVSFKYFRQNHLQGMHPGGKARQNARRDRVCLEFLVLFVQAKRTLIQATEGC